jgi:hypothetical protein
MECFDTHPSEHTFTKNLNKKLNDNNCSIHPEEPSKLECQTCNLLICVICKENGHQGHKVVYIKDTYKEKKEQIIKTCLILILKNL